ncbi:MAG TPA: hypothetical protein VF944_10560 [Candidatus Bathyarchaeia archaeon]
MIKRTSNMTYPLEAPNGWFLLRAEHQHTDVRYAADFHSPVAHQEGPWEVTFQKYPKGGSATSARGFTLEEAWRNACKAVATRDYKNMGII